MAGGTVSRPAYVLLLGAGHTPAAAQVLHALAPGALVVEPPVSGLDFFTAQGEQGRELDAWYARTDLGDAPPQLLIWHHPDLAEWVRGADAELWVAAPDQETADSYRAYPNVHAVSTWDARELARRAAAAAGPPAEQPPAPPPAPPDDPFALLAKVGPLSAVSPPTATPPQPPTAIVPLPARPPSRRPGWLDRVRALGGRRPQNGGAPELGALLAAAHPFCIAVLGPEGGASRSGSAAALATVLADAVRPLGRSVALVDGHLGHPEAWAGLALAGSPPTLDALVTALRDGRQPPSPGYGRLPSLRVYPDGPAAPDGYAPADLHRSAAHLRRENLALVVDLPSRVPQTLDGESATLAAWLAEADVTVVVTAADSRGLAAAQKWLQAEVTRGKRVVACLVGAQPRPGRDQPEVVALFQHLRSHVVRVVEIPDDDAGTEALLERGLAAAARTATLQGYARLAEVVVEVAAAQ